MHESISQAFLDYDTRSFRRHFGWIYCLIDPLDGQIRYVGKTTNIEQRLANHGNPKSGHNNQELTDWKTSLATKGLSPDMQILCTVIAESDYLLSKVLTIAEIETIKKIEGDLLRNGLRSLLNIRVTQEHRIGRKPRRETSLMQ